MADWICLAFPEYSSLSLNSVTSVSTTVAMGFLLDFVGLQHGECDQFVQVGHLLGRQLFDVQPVHFAIHRKTEPP